MTIPIPTTDVTDFGNMPGDGPLRPGGQPGRPSDVPSSKANLPSTPSAAAERQAKALELVRDIQGGSQRIRERSVVYLPMAPGEAAEDYRIRLARSVFFNVYTHTIEGLVGQVFRRDPQLSKDVPLVVRGDDGDAATRKPGHWENIDNAGTHGDVFARQLLSDSLNAGHAGIFVEYPKTGGTQRLDAEQDPNGVRPYWIPICKDNIVSWRVTVEHGRTLLRQLVLREKTMVEDGMFGEREQVRYRVLYRIPANSAVTDGTTTTYTPTPLVGFRLLEITDKKTVVEVDRGTYPTQDEIPFAEVPTSGRRGLLESDPPLLDLAYLNVAHYQQWSDYATSIHKTCVPILTIIGAERAEDGQTVVIVGPNAGLMLPVGGDAKYVAHSGQALDEAKKSLDDLKSDMGTLGLSMLAPSKRTAETAQAKRLDKATEDSALAVTARGLQDGIERALYFHARYLPGNVKDGGSIRINKEFDMQSMDAAMLTAWTNAVATAKIPPRLMVAAMQVGELIDQDEDAEDIALEMEAGMAADAQQKAGALRDQLTVATGGGGAGTGAAEDGTPAEKDDAAGGGAAA